MAICIHCEDDFDPNSIAKKRAGGKINECSDCSNETTVKYVGFQAADGKQAQAPILKFSSEQDKNQYVNFWKSVSGYYKGKSCQLSKTAPTTPGIQFKTVVAFNPTNHKGKAT